MKILQVIHDYLPRHTGGSEIHAHQTARELARRGHAVTALYTERDLSALIEGSLDEAQVVRQLERVEATRAEVNKARTLMLLHMRRVLSPDQRLGLDALHHERERGRRGPSSKPPHTR